jgi:hypothetical protein
MATDDATIMGSESHLDEKWIIVEMCGVDVYKYIEDESILTREDIENHFDEIVKHLESKKYSYHVKHQVLGYLILKTGAILPETLRNDMIQCALWDCEEEEFWSQNPRWIEPRKYFLKDFRIKIRNHVPGEKKELATIYPDDPDYVFGH